MKTIEEIYVDNIMAALMLGADPALLAKSEGMDAVNAAIDALNDRV